MPWRSRPRREVVGGASLLRLALAHGPGAPSLRQVSAWACMLGLAELSNRGVRYRLNQAAALLSMLVDRLLAAKTPGANLRWLGRGAFSHLELTDKRGAEALERGAPLAGEIRIGDRNYARAPVLQRIRAQSGNQADFIVRVDWNVFQLSTPACPGTPSHMRSDCTPPPGGVTTPCRCVWSSSARRPGQPKPPGWHCAERR